MELGLNPEAMHRLASLSACGLDTLPQNGAVMTILTIFGLNHREGYKHMFWISVVITVLSCIPGVLAAYLFY
jgi:H+/gluconate symporter-like permease